MDDDPVSTRLRWRSRRGLVALLSLVLAAASCGDSDQSETPRTVATASSVTASTPVTYDLARAGTTAGDGATPSARGRIAFVAAKEDDVHSLNIFVMSSDSGTIQLTDTGRDGQPAWSPDGSRIAFISTRDGDAEVYVMNDDGTEQTRLTHTSAGEGRPQWSPDGSRISFISDRDGNVDLFVMNADGTGPTNLTNDPAFDGAATWSPDGRWLAFASNRGATGFDIYLIDPDAGNVTRLTDDPSDEAGPARSPDGTQIAFFAGSFDTREYGLFTMDADGSNRMRLTDTNGHLGFIPAWSPDGTTIAFEHQPPGHNHELFLINLDSLVVRNLTDRSATWPTWSS